MSAPRRAPRRKRAIAPPPDAPFGCPVTTLKIGAFDYRLIFQPEVWIEKQECYGLHDSDRHEIILSSELTRRHMADIALHEINHAVWNLGRMQDVQGEENVCARHATTFTVIVRDNPEFFAWWFSLLA